MAKDHLHLWRAAGCLTLDAVGSSPFDAEGFRPLGLLKGVLVRNTLERKDHTDSIRPVAVRGFHTSLALTSTSLKYRLSKLLSELCDQLCHPLLRDSDFHLLRVRVLLTHLIAILNFFDRMIGQCTSLICQCVFFHCVHFSEQLKC